MKFEEKLEKEILKQINELGVTQKTKEIFIKNLDLIKTQDFVEAVAEFFIKLHSNAAVAEFFIKLHSNAVLECVKEILLDD